jgi:diguanylate cyclase (GGDEF)-like protein/PAS domain S-box-containing protein
MFRENGTPEANRDSKPIILIVDDDEFMRQLFRETLEKGGFLTDTACDGVEALAKFIKLRPDLVLLDLIMPMRDGFETCQEIRSLPEGMHTPVLMVTGVDNNEMIHRAFESGATDFMAKTTNPELLVYRVRCMLRNGVVLKKLQQSEDRSRMLKEAVDSLLIGITFSDASGRIVYVNPSEAHMHGYDVDELIGREAREFASSQLRSQAPPENQREGVAWRRESINLKRTGEEFPVLLTSIPVKDKEQRYLGIVTTCEDISEQKEAAERINRLAYFDLLTGLPNRGMFLDRLHQSLALATRDGYMVGLVFLDLDNFKDVNDTIGHIAGDMLLCEVALRLAGCIRESDILARLGGDEFVVLLTSVTCQERISAAAQRMLEIFAKPFQIDGRSIYSSASIGIALYPDDSHDASSLFCCADTAMYHAKKEGRATFRFFCEEMNQKNMRRVALESSLHRGLEKEEFFLHYQPQWNLKTNKMVGVEVLLRWQSVDFGLMPPSEFVSLIEESDLIFTIGEWMLKSACRQARRWADEGHPEIKVAVNISGKQLKQPEFIEMLTGIIQESGVDPRSLELEFTESVIMENVERTIEKLAALKLMGVQLSIDDFGTGYSSLNYLKHFPVDRIKIDRSFVTDMNSCNDDAAIVEAIITMAQRLKLKVLAEGVENSDQLHYLTGLGCDEVQGFYLAMPMPADALAHNLGGVHGRRIGKLAVTEWFDNRPTSMPGAPGGV